jgi:hypothetical protein
LGRERERGGSRCHSKMSCFTPPLPPVFSSHFFSLQKTQVIMADLGLLALLLLLLLPPPPPLPPICHRSVMVGAGRLTIAMVVVLKSVMVTMIM